MSQLNLIPSEIKIKRAKNQKIRNYISYGTIILAAFIIIIYSPKIYLIKLNSDEKKLDMKISQNAQIISENKKLLLNIENYNLYNNKVNMLTKQKTDVTGKIKNLEKYIPKDIALNSITYVNGALTLSGETSVYASISSFVANLQMSKEYPNSKIININDSNSTASSQQVGKYVFIIGITE